MKRRHRIYFRNGDTRRQVDVFTPKDLSSAAIIQAARGEHQISSAWRPEYREVIRRDGSVQQRIELV